MRVGDNDDAQTVVRVGDNDDAQTVVTKLVLRLLLFRPYALATWKPGQNKKSILTWMFCFDLVSKSR